MEEIFKDIEGYEGLYKIGNNGTLISCSNRSNHKEEKVLKTHITKRGYLGTKLCKNKKLKSVYIHILVAKHFVDNKNNYKTVNHIDGNKSNNNVENLEWATHKEQTKHMHNVLNVPYSDCKCCHKANKKKIIRNDGKIYNSLIEAKKDLENKNAHITEVCQGKLKSTCGYSFKYLEEGMMTY